MSVQPGDIYRRETREQAAARLGLQPGTRNEDDDLDGVVTRREPEPEGSATANFAVHLSARMRALGLVNSALAVRAGLSKVAVGRALAGTPVGIDVAEKLAAAVGGYLATMIGPYMCSTCAGEGHPGFICRECGKEVPL